MPHVRERFAKRMLLKLMKYWPVVGIVGVRQVGKTTLTRQTFPDGLFLSLDEQEIREDAAASPSAFMSKFKSPLAIDEIQKVPDLFDEIKFRVDQKRVPGTYLITGSVSFSSKIGIRESLTGRIGLLELHPLCLAEMFKRKFQEQDIMSPQARFSQDDVIHVMISGGMPVPAFARDTGQRDMYWSNWLETAIYRDLSRFFKRNYDPDFAYSLLRRIGVILTEGELPGIVHFQKPKHKTLQYLSAMEGIFLLKKMRCHDAGVGRDAWLFADSGLAAHLMGKITGEGVTLSLIRHLQWNEWDCMYGYNGKKLLREYFKSIHGPPVDAVIDGIPVRIVTSVNAVTNQFGWTAKPLLGAMKKLGSKKGIILAPVARVSDAGDGMFVVPWCGWS